MLQVEVFICKLFGAVDGPGAGAIAVDEITSLDHEILDLIKYQHTIALVMNDRKWRSEGADRLRILEDSPHDGTCNPCSLAAGHGCSWSLQCRTGGSSQLSWGRRF